MSNQDKRFNKKKKTELHNTGSTFMVGFGTKIGTNEQKKSASCSRSIVLQAAFFLFMKFQVVKLKFLWLQICMILYLRKHSPKFGGGKKKLKNHTKSPDSYIWFK
jgi:hypothetical protein